MKIFLKSNGCRLNQHLSKRLLSLYTNNECSITDSINDAHTIIIAGCVVTHKAEAQLRRYINSIKEKFPNKKIILSGCIPDYLKNGENITFIPQNDIMEINSKVQLRSREDILIQTGCNNFCSYCTVPYYRDKEISRSVKLIINDIRNAEKSGIREIILTGVHISRYNYKNTDFVDLLKIIYDNFSSRIRLSSLDINEINDELLDFIDNNESIAPFMHLSLQHTEDEVLESMKRNYKTMNIINIITKIQNMKRHIRIGADIIVGFPGETENDFNKMMEFLYGSPISHYHIFRYSVRNNTLSAYMKKHINEKTKKMRLKIMETLYQEKRKLYLNSTIGTIKNVVIEQSDDNGSYGTSGDYLRIFTPQILKVGELHNLSITGFDNDLLIAD